MTMKLSLTKAQLAMVAYVAQFSADKDIRFYINGVCLQNHKDGLFAVATNGHIMAYARLGDAQDEQEFELILSNVFVKDAILSFKDAGDLTIEQKTIEGQNYIEANGASTRKSMKAMGGRYPDWRRVFPSEDAEPVADTVGFNPKYLAVFEKAYKAFKKFDKSIGEGVAVTLHGPTNAAVFVPRDAPEIRAVVMPMRV